MHRESKKPRKRRMLGKSTLFPSLLYITNNWNKENVNIGTYAVVDPGEGPGVPSPSLFPVLLDQTEARRAKKIFLETTPLPATYHRVWMTGPPVI